MLLAPIRHTPPETPTGPKFHLHHSQSENSTPLKLLAAVGLLIVFSTQASNLDFWGKGTGKSTLLTNFIAPMELDIHLTVLGCMLVMVIHPPDRVCMFDEKVLLT